MDDERGGCRITNKRSGALSAGGIVCDLRSIYRAFIDAFYVCFIITGTGRLVVSHHWYFVLCFVRDLLEAFAHLFCFPSAYFSSLESSAKMSAMPSVTHEVKLMLGQPVEEQAVTNAKFGAKDVMDLTWKNALDAYSCTECGRCTEQCPANQTGRALSPRKIMMDTRDRLEEVGGILKANKGAFVEDGKSLFDRISAEELRACTSCQACVEACPMELSPLSIILEMRRFQIMELSDAPGAWNAMFANVETNQSPWKFNPADRLNWAKE